MCREAGCGCCSVTVSHLLPDSDKLQTYSVQSCLTPLYAVDDWQISTVEGIGSQKVGFHPIQERIAKFNGTQCGYCTPGMVMNMYGLLHQNPNITTQEIEDNFDGNICRCTGYRSILDAMKSFSTDGNIPGAKPVDIEDLNKHLCPRTGEPCTGHQEEKGGKRNLDIEVNGSRWYRPTSLKDLGKLLKDNVNKKVKMIFGNTSTGIFKNEEASDIYIDLHRVEEIYCYQLSDAGVTFGAATSLTNLMNKLKADQDKAGFHYFSAVVRHLKFIGNVMVRNAGSIAGNLMIKHKHPDFPSDIFTVLEALGAKVDIFDADTSTTATYTMLDFLRKVNMTGKVIVAVQLPKLAENEVFRSFKITPRWQNAHAYVNAAFRLPAVGRDIKGRPSLVYGGINADTEHALKTEEFLTNKTLSDAIVQEALTILSNELNPEYDQVLSSPKYRKDLSISLLYKVLLGIYNPSNPKLRSGPENIHRPISSGLQTYQEIKTELPLKQAMPKITAPLQASGEAVFINDMPAFKNELHAAFVLSDVGPATLVSIDASEALVQAFNAVKKVKATYTDLRKPVLSLDDSMSLNYKFDSKVPDVSLAVPSEDGIDLYASTQSADLNQHAAANVIGKPMNYVNVTVPRLGGGFGGKAWDSCSTSTACTLAAYLTGKPVRIALDLSTNMRLCGKRPNIITKYKVGFSNDGNIQVIDMDLYGEVGHNDGRTSDFVLIAKSMDMCYYVPNWHIRVHLLKTDKQNISPVRGPGSIPASLIIETIMEHVAKAIDRHPILVKELNLYEKDQIDLNDELMSQCTIRDLWRRLKDIAEVEGRMRIVDAFNQENLWKKRGITMTSCKYDMNWFGTGQAANVSIYGRDGTVVICQGGVEMGQGLYTKVIQGVAYILGVPIDLIKVRPNQNIVTPNNNVSGASVSSEMAMQASIEASNILKARMQPIREKFPDASWKELCVKCVQNRINLNAHYSFSLPAGRKTLQYYTYCAAVIETEVDVLTGESQIRRVDLMADFGESLNPTIDIGQAEGAFVMGLGCYLSEDIIFDGQTGRILNDGTWEYKPPTTKDIPIDWRIYLLPDTPNPSGIRSSKGVGEPTISLAVGALLANKLAVHSARKDLFGANDYIPSVSPYTVERVQQSVGLTADKLTF
nr:xanthine dehydrogenase-like [Biomphalaria glabrata]